MFFFCFKGALAVECREGDEFIQGLLHKLIDDKTTFQIIAERSFMQFLEGGCSIPLGVRSEFVEEEDNKKEEKDKKEDSKKEDKSHLDEIKNLKLSGAVISLDGQKRVQFNCKLKDVDLNSMCSDKIDCTKIVLPISACPKQIQIKEQYYACAKLGIHTAKQLQSLGAQSILDEINKDRKPLNE